MSNDLSSFFFFFFRSEVKHRCETADSFGLIYPVDAVNPCNRISFGLINSNPTPARDLDRSDYSRPFFWGRSGIRSKRFQLKMGH